MKNVLKYEEIKNEHYVYSDSYEVKFWILTDREIWAQRNEIYYAKNKNKHNDVLLRWKEDYKNKNVKFISISYQ